MPDEHETTGEVASIFAEIRQVFGLPFVPNLGSSQKTEKIVR
jgi:hypothetical protein